MNINITKTSESCFRVKLEERELRQDLQLLGVLEFWKMKFDIGQKQRKNVGVLARLLHSIFIGSALVPLSFDLWVEKSCWWENGEAIVFYDYSISSGPFFLWSLTWETLLVKNGEDNAFYDYSISSGPFSSWLLTLILNQTLRDQDQGPKLDKISGGKGK